MRNIGQVGEFEPSTESLNTYLDKINEYFVANSIGVPAKNTDAICQAADRQKVAALNSIIGKAAYSVLSDLTKPNKPSTKTFDELCALLHNHYQPKAKEVAETLKFHGCMQLENETVNTYTARLRSMANKCNFGRFLNHALREQFVSGNHNRDTQKKLLEEDREFQECVTIAAADETARRESETYKQVQIHRYISFLIRRKLLTRNLYYTPILHVHTSATHVVKWITKEKSVNSKMLNVINARERDIYPNFVKVKNSSYFKRRMKMRVVVKGQFMLCQIQ